MAELSYAGVAKRYAERVCSGQVPACEWVRYACARHLADLKASKRKAFGFYFDEEQARRVCRFVELLPHTKGKWAREGQKLKLEPWQVFLTCVIFGWMRNKDDLRRFRRVFLLIPRKNGKSALAAAWGLYMLTADGEHGAEVYSGATTEKQAWEVFRPARIMASKTPALLSFYGVDVNAASIHRYADGSRMEPIIGDPGDGSSPSCAIHDEYHEHATDTQVDAMLTGMGARDQPLQLVISTAGMNTAGPCYAAQKEAERVLSGVNENDELFACIWTIDKGDDWTSLDTLRKANPNYGVSVGDDFLSARLTEAKQNARKQGIFQTKHLNVWVNAKHAYFNMHLWQSSGTAVLDRRRDGLRQYIARRQAAQPGVPVSCVVGIDLASKIDLNAMAILFRNHDGNNAELFGPKYTAFARYYLPADTVELPENEAYQQWEREGWLDVTNGAIVNYNIMKEDLLDLCSLCQVELVAYDPFQATKLVTELMDEGVPVLEWRQIVATMSEPMKELDGLIRGGLIEHDTDPITEWCIGNVVAQVDRKDNVYPNRERVESKIDGGVALIMALGADMNGERPSASVYETRGLLEVEA